MKSERSLVTNAIGEELEKEISSLPKDEEIELQIFGKWGFKPNADIIGGIKAIPTNVNVLKLVSNDLGRKTAAELGELFAALKPHIKSLYLAFNDLNKVADLHTAIAGITNGVTLLSLATNSLHKKSSEQLIQIFQAIPESVNNLDLFDNDLSQMNIDGLVAAISAIPKHIHTLDLGGNRLSSLKGEDLGRVLAAIPAHVTTLHFTQEQRANVNNLAVGLKSLSPLVTTLTFHNNDLGRWPGAKLKEFFAAIPETVKELGLTGNDFRQDGNPEFDVALRGLHKEFTKIDFSKNAIFDSFETDNLIKILEALGSNLSKAHMPTSDSSYYMEVVKEMIEAGAKPEITAFLLKPMTDQIQKALREHLNDGKYVMSFERIKVKGLDKLTDPLVQDELITCLTNQRSPLALLSAALLLQNRIIQVTEVELPENMTQKYSKEQIDALISFIKMDSAKVPEALGPIYNDFREHIEKLTIERNLRAIQIYSDFLKIEPISDDLRIIVKNLLAETQAMYKDKHPIATAAKAVLDQNKDASLTDSSATLFRKPKYSEESAAKPGPVKKQL